MKTNLTSVRSLLTGFFFLTFLYIDITYAQVANYWQCDQKLVYEGDDGFVHSYLFNIPPGQGPGPKLFKYYGYNMNVPDGIRINVDGVDWGEFWVGKDCASFGSGLSMTDCRKGPAMWSNESGSVEVTTLTNQEYATAFSDSLYFFTADKGGTIHARILVPEDACQVKIDVLSNTASHTYWEGVLRCPELTCPQEFELTQTPMCMSTQVEIDYPSCENYQQGNVTWTGPAPFEPTGGPIINTNISGDYTATISYANACFLEAHFTLEDALNLMDIEYTEQAPLCPDSSDGSISASVSGGIPPYSYEWNTGATTNSIENIPAGNYTLTITDASGCEQVDNFHFAGLPPIQVNPQITNPTCDVATNGAINLNTTGGTGPYTYQWNTGEISPSLSGLGTGTYTVTATDSRGCVATQDIQVVAGEVFQINFDIDNVNCYGFENGSIETTLSGVVTGTADYQWNHGPTTPNLSQLGPNDYVLTVTDQAGCSVTEVATITQPDAPLSFTFDTFGTQCEDASNGWIQVHPEGGTPGYSATAEGESSNEDLVIPNLPHGTHEIEVVDANGCKAYGEGTIDVRLADARIYMEFDELNCSYKTTLEVFYQDNGDLVHGYPKDITSRTKPSDIGRTFPYESNGCHYNPTVELRGDLPDYLKGTFPPNAFSPNDDGYNDVYSFYTKDLTPIKSFRIFDRWGNNVHERTNFEANSSGSGYEWDGRFRGQAMNPGVYVYVIVFKQCNKQISGDITLVK